MYRVSAAKSDILQLKEFFDSNHPDLSRKIEKADVHVVTGVLKKFLMELPEPLEKRSNKMTRGQDDNEATFRKHSDKVKMTTKPHSKDLRRRLKRQRSHTRKTFALPH